MLLFQQTSYMPQSFPPKALSFEALMGAIKNLKLPHFMEARISDFAKRTGSERDDVLALALLSMELTPDGLKRIQNAKWSAEDKKILTRMSSDISNSSFAGGLHAPAAQALNGAGLPAKKADVLAFVESHIDMIALSFLAKLKAANTDNRKLNEKDIEHADFSMTADRANFTMCFANIACFPVDLLRMKNDPGRVSKIAGSIESGKMDRAHVNELFGKNAWENLQTIASSILNAFAKYAADVLAKKIPEGSIWYIQNEMLFAQSSKESEEQKQTAKGKVPEGPKGGFA